jgi:hypothetical protein
MPYLSTNEVSQIRTELKSAYPQYKFSVVRDGYSSVIVSIMAGPTDLSKYNDRYINRYHLESQFRDTPSLLPMMQELVRIVGGKQENESYDGDYGWIPNYYYTIQIGKWNRPYEIQK